MSPGTPMFSYRRGSRVSVKEEPPTLSVPIGSGLKNGYSGQADLSSQGKSSGNGSPSAQENLFTQLRVAPLP